MLVTAQIKRHFYSIMSQSWACLRIGQRAPSPARVSEKRRCVAVMQQQLQHPPPLKNTASAESVRAPEPAAVRGCRSSRRVCTASQTHMSARRSREKRSNHRETLTGCRVHNLMPEYAVVPLGCRSLEVGQADTRMP